MNPIESRTCCDFMDFPSEYLSNVYTIPIENIGKFRDKDVFRLLKEVLLSKGDSNAVERTNQVKPAKEDPSEKALQALARRQRRLDGLKLFEESKLNTYSIHSFENLISN